MARLKAPEGLARPSQGGREPPKTQGDLGAECQEPRALLALEPKTLGSGRPVGLRVPATQGQ